MNFDTFFCVKSINHFWRISGCWKRICPHDLKKLEEEQWNNSIQKWPFLKQCTFGLSSGSSKSDSKNP